MGQEALVIEEIEAGAKLIASFNDAFPVKVACWVKLADERRWHLYISSDKFDNGDIYSGYEVIQRLTKELDDPFLHLFRVTLIRPDDPLALAASEVHKKFHARLPVNYNWDSLGRIPIDGAYFYALPTRVADPSLAHSTSP
jgi:hypothetical protein